MYYRVDTNQVLSNHSEVRQSFLTGNYVVIFSDSISDEDLAARGVFPMTYVKPDTDANQVAIPTIVRLVDGVWVQQWTVRLATADEVQAMKPEVPPKVTRRQARQALMIKGVLDKVQPAIDAIPDATTRGLAQIEWDDSQDFERNRPLLIQLGTGIGLDANGMDELFIFAATL